MGNYLQLQHFRNIPWTHLKYTKQFWRGQNNENGDIVICGLKRSCRLLLFDLMMVGHGKIHFDIDMMLLPRESGVFTKTHLSE